MRCSLGAGAEEDGVGRGGQEAWETRVAPVQVPLSLVCHYPAGAVPAGTGASPSLGAGTGWTRCWNGVILIFNQGVVVVKHRH